MKGEEDEKFRYITDFDAKSLWRKMSRAYEPDKVKLSDVQNVIQSDYAAPYNPLVSYLENLPEWTEEQPDYLAELARTVTVKGGDREQKLFEEYLKKWMVAMVAAWVEPDVVNHTVLVLIGGQGVNKTTWFNFLLPPRLKRYFTLLLNTKNLSDKDEKLKLSFKALVSIEEIEKMDDSLSTYIKAVITAPDTDIRVSYGRFSEQRPHIASFCGTGNNVQFLNEAVSRRWLPFEVTSIVSPRQHPFNHDGIFAQTYHLFRTGFRYWFDLDEINVLARHNRDYQVPCMEEELIPLHFRKPGPEEVGQFFPTTAILKHIGDNISYKLSLVKVGMAMKNLGFERRRNKATKGWICIPINPQDFVDQRKRMAMHSVDDDEQNATLENEGGIA
jgi:predicted P-loop ATPase